MEYDRESFLAGFAVGRTLWRPHRLAEGRTLAAIPCFPMGEPIDLEWNYRTVGATHDFTKFLLTNPEGRYPSPAYWMLWEYLDIPDYAILIFSADPSWVQSDNYVYQTYGYEQAIQNWWQIGATAGSFGTVYDSDIAKWQTYNRPFGGGMSASEFFGVIPYLSASERDKNSFMSSARLVQGPGQLYVVGEIS